MSTCKALGINPEAYLEDLLEHVATTHSPDFATLTPWAWAKRHGPSTASDPRPA